MQIKNKEIVIVGYSGHALVVAEILLQLGFSIRGYMERTEVSRNLLSITYLGFEQNPNDLKKIMGIPVFLAIGDNHIRSKAFNFLKENGFDLPTAIAIKACVSSKSEINEGTLVSHGVCINPFVQIGKGVIVNTGAIVEHECIIDDFAHIAPGVVLAGNVKVGKGCFIGANTVVKQGVVIGANSIIGAGAVVLHNVAENQKIAGNPARII
jgi:acetyltransferase EpsM